MRRTSISLTSTVFAFFLTTSFIFSATSFASSAGDDGQNQFAQKGLGISANFGKWTGGIVPWVYNPTGAPAGYQNDVAVRDLIESSQAEWAAVCNLTFVRADIDGDGIDSTINIDLTNDNIAVFGWDETIGGAGLAGPASNNATVNSLGRWQYIDGTLELRPSVFSQTGLTGSQITRNLLAYDQTMLHEIGHLIGLGHSDAPLSIMYANPYNSLNHIRTDDIEACRSIYGYSNTYTPPEQYVAPTAGTTTFDYLRLVAQSDTFPGGAPITSIDDQTDDVLMVEWQLTGSPGYNETVTQVIVDPEGYITSIVDAIVQNGFVGRWGIASFDLMREVPGTWTIHVYDSTGLLSSQPFNVNTALPVVNQAPDVDFSYTENPDTRAISLTANVTGDNEGDNATVIWHIPTEGATTIPLGGSSGIQNEAVTLNNGIDNEMWVEVNDDSMRYDGTGPGNVGPAGAGFQRLLRYNSSRRNIGPDLNGDNSSDVFWRNSTTGVNWMYGLNGNFIRASELINTVSGAGWNIVGVADFDGNGKSDVLWRNSVTGANWMYLMDGSTIQSSSLVNVEGDQNWQIVATADFTGNGRADILWRHATTGRNWLYEMNGALINNSSLVNTVGDLNWDVVASGDYNGDGNADILWRNSADGRNWMYLMNGSTITQSLFVNIEGDLDWRIVGSGDYNGDGMSDILWRKYSPPGGSRGRNWVYLMNGNTITQSLLISHEPDLNWDIVGNGDYNGDGRADILWRNSSTGRNWMFQMNGATVTDSVLLNTEGDQDWQIVEFD